ELRALEGAETFEGRDAEGALETLAAALAVEALRRQGRQPLLPGREQLEPLGLLQQAIGHQQLARREPCQRRVERARRHWLHREIAGGEVEPGEAEPTHGLRERRQIIVSARIEERVLGERTR